MRDFSDIMNQLQLVAEGIVPKIYKRTKDTSTRESSLRGTKQSPWLGGFMNYCDSRSLPPYFHPGGYIVSIVEF